MTLHRSAFPKDFLWGTATSSYQIEGGFDEDGRGESIWDRFSLMSGHIRGGANGNTACDHYHRYPEDVKLLHAIGCNTYRFSIAWSRIFPTGSGAANPAGLGFYDRLVDELLKAKIQPMATLYHWDLPQALQDEGGWVNRSTAQAFADYAWTVARHLGDRVKYWTTHNEPWCTAFLGYVYGIFAPGIKDDLPAALQAGHHMLLSHGLAMPMIRSVSPGAQVGIALNLEPAYPATQSKADLWATKRYDGYFNRWFLDPLAGRGYPTDMLAYYGKSAPKVQTDDFYIIARKLDYLGVNYYTRALIAEDPAGSMPQVSRVDDPEQERSIDREIYPEGLYDLLVRLSKEYPFTPLMVTENGAAFADEITPDGKIHDEQRIKFLQAHLEQALRALQDGVPLAGYFIWSLLDNFEWAAGYSLRYGITYVDFATQRRIPKDSALWLHSFLKQKG
jgi:beta-glucosidase